MNPKLSRCDDCKYSYNPPNGYIFVVCDLRFNEIALDNAKLPEGEKLTFNRVTECASTRFEKFVVPSACPWILEYTLEGNSND